ncbi:MAG TPA: SAM-dependent chlorinase/fluorinase, partial [Longimicrobiaceae bacterium]|nr:SAM-dependent chlorinase/fluorinase [Longimicrobiaceae bacterium]
RVFDVTGEEAPASATFHGRDLFAPVAAALATGTSPTRLGVPATDPVRLDPLRPERAEDGALRGRVLHVDRFGNCVTPFTRAELPEGAAFRLAAGGAEVRTLRRFYAEGEGEEVFAIWGSAGFLELSALRDSAARRLGLRAGDELTLAREGE